MDYGWVGDLKDGAGIFGWCVLITLGASLLLMLITCLCTGLITWLLAISLGLVLISFGVLLILAIYYTGPLNDGMNAARVKYLAFFM